MPSPEAFSAMPVPSPEVPKPLKPEDTSFLSVESMPIDSSSDSSELPGPPLTEEGKKILQENDEAFKLEEEIIKQEQEEQDQESVFGENHSLVVAGTLPEQLSVKTPDFKTRRITQNTKIPGEPERDIIKYKTVKRSEQVSTEETPAEETPVVSAVESLPTTSDTPTPKKPRVVDPRMDPRNETPPVTILKKEPAKTPEVKPAVPTPKVPEASKPIEKPTPKTPENPKTPPTPPTEKPRVADSRMVAEEDKSLRGRIDSANRASEKAVDFDELGREKGWFRSAFNKLSIKMGWSKDIANEVRLNTVNKLGMGYDNFWNNRLVKKKTREIARLDKKISRENGNTREDKLAKENIDRLNKLIEEAGNNNDSNMVRILTERRDEMVERGTSKKDQLEAERSSLASQLERYKDRKVAILDNFVSSVEMQTEKVRNQENYHENVKKRSTINIEIERMLDVMSQTESQIISLKKALAFTKDKEDRYAIKESIREHKEWIKESKWKRTKYERFSRRLGKFIDLTDKRTKRFDDLKGKYLNRRDHVVEKNKSGGSRMVPPPLPKTPTPVAKESVADTGSGLETATEEEPVETKVESNESDDRRFEKEHSDIVERIVKKITNFEASIKQNNENDNSKNKVIEQKAIDLKSIFDHSSKNDIFSKAEKNVFIKSTKSVDTFLLQIKKDGGKVTAYNREKIESDLKDARKELSTIK